MNKKIFSFMLTMLFVASLFWSTTSFVYAQEPEWPEASNYDLNDQVQREVYAGKLGYFQGYYHRTPTPDKNYVLNEILAKQAPELTDETVKNKFFEIYSSQFIAAFFGQEAKWQRYAETMGKRDGMLSPIQSEPDSTTVLSTYVQNHLMPDQQKKFFEIYLKHYLSSNAKVATEDGEIEPDWNDHDSLYTYAFNWGRKYAKKEDYKDKQWDEAYANYKANVLKKYDVRLYTNKEETIESAFMDGWNWGRAGSALDKAEEGDTNTGVDWNNVASIQHYARKSARTDFKAGKKQSRKIPDQLISVDNVQKNVQDIFQEAYDAEYKALKSNDAPTVEGRLERNADGTLTGQGWDDLKQLAISYGTKDGKAVKRGTPPSRKILGQLQLRQDEQDRFWGLYCEAYAEAQNESDGTKILSDGRRVVTKTTDVGKLAIAWARYDLKKPDAVASTEGAYDKKQSFKPNTRAQELVRNKDLDPSDVKDFIDAYTTAYGNHGGKVPEGTVGESEQGADVTKQVYDEGKKLVEDAKGKEVTLKAAVSAFKKFMKSQDVSESSAEYIANWKSFVQGYTEARAGLDNENDRDKIQSLEGISFQEAFGKEGAPIDGKGLGTAAAALVFVISAAAALKGIRDKYIDENGIWKSDVYLMTNKEKDKIIEKAENQFKRVRNYAEDVRSLGGLDTEEAKEANQKLEEAREHLEQIKKLPREHSEF